MKKRMPAALFAMILGLGAAVGAGAHPVTGEIFFTTFSGGPNVWRVGVDYDGATFTLGSPVNVGTTPGADGIVGNPKNSDLLIVGGQGTHVNTISKTTGAVVTTGSPVDVFHLAVPTADTLLVSSIPGFLARHPILAGGLIGLGTSIALTGDDTLLTTIIPTPGGYFYTASDSAGIGNYGSIAFNTGIDSATSAVTTRLHTSLAGTHGGTYDPFTGSVIIIGDSHVTQLDDNATATILSDLAVGGGVIFDQGAVDGAGHLFAASNTGSLLFLDYAASGLVGDLGNFSALPFLMGSLDDVAPLVGPGRTTVPAPGTLLLFGIALVALRRFARTAS